MVSARTTSRADKDSGTVKQTCTPLLLQPVRPHSQGVVSCHVGYMVQHAHESLLAAPVKTAEGSRPGCFICHAVVQPCSHPYNARPVTSRPAHQSNGQAGLVNANRHTHHAHKQSHPPPGCCSAQHQHQQPPVCGCCSLATPRNPAAYTRNAQPRQKKTSAAPAAAAFQSHRCNAAPSMLLKALTHSLASPRKASTSPKTDAGMDGSTRQTGFSP